MSAIQNERVLAALRRGDVSTTDFLLPDVVDGGKPITRVGARIKDLRDAGCQIDTLQVRPVGLYRLVAETSAQPPSGAPPASRAEHGTGGRSGQPAPVSHVGITTSDLQPSGPAWADASNQFSGADASLSLSAIDDTDDGDAWWLAA